MDNINLQLAKIKGMMKMIQEAEFTPTMTPEQWELNSIVMSVIAEWAEDGKYLFDDYDLDLNNGNFFITGGDYTLEYSFDIEITSHGWFRAGTYEDPPEGEGTQYEFVSWHLKIIENDDKVLYDGEDFTKFEQMIIGSKGGRKYTGGDLLYDMFDERINDMDDDNRGRGDW